MTKLITKLICNDCRKEMVAKTFGLEQFELIILYVCPSCEREVKMKQHAVSEDSNPV